VLVARKVYLLLIFRSVPETRISFLLSGRAFEPSTTHAVRKHTYGATNRPRRATVQLVDRSVCLPGGRFLMKGSDERGRNTRRKTSNLFQTTNCSSGAESELSILFRKVSEVLACTSRGSPERRNALASLENISGARAFVMSARQP
jgi:hypothetical protein